MNTVEENILFVMVKKKKRKGAQTAREPLTKLNVTPLSQPLGSVHGLVPGSSSKYLHLSQLTSIHLTVISTRPLQVFSHCS